MTAASPGTADAQHTASGADAVGWWSLVAVVFTAALLIDPFADRAFDAPKRLFMLGGGCIAMAALLWRVRPASVAASWARLDSCWRRWPAHARRAMIFAALAAAGMIVATVVSPHAEIAQSALRTIAITALLLPLGASRLLAGARGERFLQLTIAAIACSALISIAQAVGWKLPLTVLQVGGRFPTGALLGNEGYVALACALMAAACLAIAAWPMPWRRRALPLGLALLGILTIAVNRQLTSALALVPAIMLIVAVRWRQRWIVALGAAVAALMIAATLVPALRSATLGAGQAPGVSAIERFQRMTTYRLGAWIAAMDMAAARPLTGFGPGTFGAQATAHRLAAEIRLRERLVQPLGASFVYAHQEYLQLAGEAGIPALVALLAAIAMIVLGAWRRVWPGSPAPPADSGSAGNAMASASPAREITVLLAVLAVGAVAALAWFPLQIPLTAVILLLACGRAWRVGVDGSDAAAARGTHGRRGDQDAAPGRPAAPPDLRIQRSGRLASRTLLLLVLCWLMRPEVERYRVEWSLAQASARLEVMLLGIADKAGVPRLAREAELLAANAQKGLPGDARAPLAQALALIIQRQGPAAIAVLVAALADGERPEFTINLGRARGISGDEAGAARAFLRTAWLSPAAIATLPAALRQPILDDVGRLETALREGRLREPPPLD